jgi:hypothetical protein
MLEQWARQKDKPRPLPPRVFRHSGIMALSATDD